MKWQIRWGLNETLMDRTVKFSGIDPWTSMNYWFWMILDGIALLELRLESGFTFLSFDSFWGGIHTQQREDQPAILSAKKNNKKHLMVQKHQLESSFLKWRCTKLPECLKSQSWSNQFWYTCQCKPFCSSVGCKTPKTVGQVDQRNRWQKPLAIIRSRRATLKSWQL